MAKTILVIDDKKELLTLVKDYMTQEGYRVVTATEGQEGLFVARHEKPDLIILDLMMPEMDGYDFLRIYQKEAATPIIILTAKMDENEKVLGLELGADDYVTKPFSLRELSARVKAVLRRGSKGVPEPKKYHVGEVMLDRDERLVMVGAEEVKLTPSEFDILAAMIAEPGRVFSRMDLLERLQGIAFDGTERIIDVHVSNLRAKIEPDPGTPTYIETVYGFGYRFASEK